jgi:aromatic ring-opening dioxygenase LigB subunit
MIIFACISPHPPIILPTIGSEKDRAQVKNTIEALEKLGKKLKEMNPDLIIISSPHPDWGFEVPLYFLAKNFQGNIEKILIGLESPQFYFEKGTKFPISNFQFSNKSQIPKSKIALIASGDLSHCLKTDGPYGFQPDGPKFDKTLIESLKKKDIDTILKLDEMFPEAGECGLRSFCFLLGILEAHSTSSGQAWQPEILSYEGPFGVGYLVANFKL